MRRPFGPENHAVGGTIARTHGQVSAATRAFEWDSFLYGKSTVLFALAQQYGAEEWDRKDVAEAFGVPLESVTRGLPRNLGQEPL